MESIARDGLLINVGWLCLAQDPVADLFRADPAAYLNRALDEMQRHALRRDAVDWPRVRAEALARASNAEMTVDTYDAIRFALVSLGDHHSSFHPTPALEKLESERKAQHSVSQSANVAAVPHNQFVGRYEPEGRLAVLNKTFAIVVVTKCFPENDAQFTAFETKLQQIMDGLDRSRPTGWVVDLRGNVEGNMWPMLAGIGPLLGEGDHLGEFLSTEGHSVWKYRDEVASEVEANGKENRYPPVAGSPLKLTGTAPVAVLIDYWTGSSGEALAIAFKGRAKTRFFGQHTQGVSTVNQVFSLSDGSAMWLTIGVDADRNGRQYWEGLNPDEAIPGTLKPTPDDQDTVLQRALQWLSAQNQAA